MMAKTQNEAFFQIQLMAWFEQNYRPLPWKGERNPYFIWLSEIILQQTRVAQGMPYYIKFTEHYPTVKMLADAPEDEVMKLWEGLGYYSRARNLHAAAKYITYDLGGFFPVTYQDLLKIIGVGAYTAAAIASFAYDLPHAVVDGNVYRVLSRFFGIETPIDSLVGQKEFKQLADILLDGKEPARYNQAIMDFGATHCLPKLAKCATCCLSKKCVAAQEKKVNFLPVKEKKLVKKNRYFHYLVFNFENSFWITRREEKDIWQQLYEFPMIESECFLENAQLFDNEIFTQYFFTQVNNQNTIKISKPYKQLLTHQTIFAQFYEVKLVEKPENLPNNWRSVSMAEIKKFAFPKLFDWYFQDKYLSLSLF